MCLLKMLPPGDCDSAEPRAMPAGPVRLLLGVTGSVAAIKSVELVHAIRSSGLVNEIILVLTKSSLNFFSESDFRELSNEIKIKYYTDENHFEGWKAKGDPILHIDLARWASCVLVAPMSANTLAKISNGLCNNLLTNVMRAWDYKKKPFLFAPAMNTKMYEHPITAEQIARLKSWGAFLIEPVAKTLACGDYGMGAMAPIDSICSELFQATSETKQVPKN